MSLPPILHRGPRSGVHNEIDSTEKHRGVKLARRAKQDAEYFFFQFQHYEVQPLVT